MTKLIESELGNNNVLIHLEGGITASIAVIDDKLQVAISPRGCEYMPIITRINLEQFDETWQQKCWADAAGIAADDPTRN